MAVERFRSFRNGAFMIMVSGVLMLAFSSACTGLNHPPIVRIALLAPFEGRYREVGYNAFYAARMAFQDAAPNNIELLAVDDGGLAERTIDRAKALDDDPLVKVVIVLGLAASSPQVQAAVTNKPMLIVGSMGYSAHHS